MKLKTRIIVGFGMSILVPLLLFSATLYGLGHTKFAQQTKDSSEVVYDISVGESTHSQTQVRIIAKDLLFTATVILVFTALSIGLWIYRSIATPLVKLKKATQNIKEGNLDFVLEVDGDDEFSELCRDFEEMRKRLKESAEEKVLMDKENKVSWDNLEQFFAVEVIEQSKRNAKRWFLAWIVTLAALIGTNAAWIYVAQSYEYVSQDGSGQNNINTGTQGDVTHGTENEN